MISLQTSVRAVLPIVMMVMTAVIPWNSVSAQLTNETIVVAGVARSFLKYLPEGYNESDVLPLVLCFHGGSGTAYDQLALGDLRAKADEEEFILVYPQALPDPNDGGSTNWQLVISGELPFTTPNPHSDIDFVSSLIDYMEVNHGVDVSRVYAMGYSNGGGFVYDLACRLNDQITGIGAVSRTMYAETYAACQTSHPTPVVTILGTNDFNSNYDGVSYQGTLYYHSSDEGNQLWIEKNDLLVTPDVMQMPNLDPNDGSSVERYRWTSEDECIELTHYKVVGGDHDWPGTFGNMDIVSHELIWDALSAHDMNGKIICSDESEGCPEDVNADGAVNVADVLSVLSDFGCSSNCSDDVNGDSAVNVTDILMLLAAFGNDC